VCGWKARRGLAVFSLQACCVRCSLPDTPHFGACISLFCAYDMYIFPRVLLNYFSRASSMHACFFRRNCSSAGVGRVQKQFNLPTLRNIENRNGPPRKNDNERGRQANSFVRKKPGTDILHTYFIFARSLRPPTFLKCSPPTAKMPGSKGRFARYTCSHI
jgi:hypothetical protein